VTIPSHWSDVRIGDVLVAKYGKSLPQVKRQPGGVPVYGSNGVVGSHDRPLTSGKTIIIGRKGSSGAVNFSLDPCWPIDTAFYIDNPGPFKIEFLDFVLRSLGLTAMDRSTAIPGLSREQFYEITIPLPPLSEQDQIVAALDSFGSHRTQAGLHIAKTYRTIKRYRQSILLAASSGRLTETWRNESGQTEWQTALARDVCEKVQSGGTPKTGFTNEPGIPFLKVYNIVNQHVDFFQRPQYVPENVHAGVLRKSIAYPGDVIMNIVGPPLGKVAIIPHTHPEWNLNQAITIFRPGPRILGEWLYIYLCSGIFLDDEALVTRGSAGQSNISLTQCRNLVIPVPSLDEQHEIVRRFSELLSASDALLTRLSVAGRAVERSSRAILAKAFRGDLLPPPDVTVSV
jgi:type I restriction enzyme S subunit